MSILQYPKHQFIFKLNNNELTDVMKFTPSESGYLKHIRLKVIVKDYDSILGRSKLIVRAISTGSILDESNWVDYSSVSKATTGKLWHSFIRFDFNELALKDGVQYQLSLYQENAEEISGGYFGYCLDYNFLVNQTSIPNHVRPNARLSAEIYLLRDYYEFE